MVIPKEDFRMKYFLIICLILCLTVGCSSDNRPRGLDELMENTIQGTITMEDGSLIVFELYPDLAPQTVRNFVYLARQGFYDGLTFHRVIPDFMIQGGCPDGTGCGDPGYKFEDEFDDELAHDSPGILSMANSGPVTNGSQFFITHVPCPWLDGKHTVFGKVLEGQDVVDEIEADDVMESVVVQDED